MQTRRTEYRNLGVVIAFISFCVVLLIYGVREELAVAGLIASATYFIYRRPITLICYALGIGFFALWVRSMIFILSYAQSNDISSWFAFAVGMLWIAPLFWIAGLIGRKISPLQDKEQRRIKEQGAVPSLSVKELKRLQKENREMTLEETLRVMSDT